MANKIYSSAEQSVVFISSSVGSGANYTSLNPAGLLNGSGVRSDVRDLGPFPRSTLFRWRAKFGLAASGDPQGSVEIYWAGFDSASDLSPGSGVYFPLALAGSGHAVTPVTSLKKNLQYVGAVDVGEEASAGSPRVYTSDGVAQIHSRYGSFLLWNHAGTALSNTLDHHAVSLTPMPDEVQ